MTYKEGLAIAQKYGLENEFTAEYNYALKYSNDYCDPEAHAVKQALEEWDLLPLEGIPSASFDNCNELIAWMESPETQEELCLKPVNGVKATIEFQGDIVEVSYYEPDIDKGFFYIKGDNIFFVSEVEDDGRFEVKCIHNECAWGGDYYLVLPKYVRDEFIATLKGEW